MHTTVVWVLLIIAGREYGNGSYGGPVVIDNLPSRDHCMALRADIARQQSAANNNRGVLSATCHGYRKLLP